MRKILVFGNSGSGKSTLARKFKESMGLAHLDLDELAWLDTSPPQRAPLENSLSTIKEFIRKNKEWVVEGCYTDLLELTQAYANEIIFLNLPIDQCLLNARNRQWEPNKYPSKEAQDENLEILLDWIAQYDQRDDVFSLQSHLQLYNNFSGKKTMYCTNERDS